MIVSANEKYRISINASIYENGFLDDENYLIIALNTKI
jgi:hypothetical protein